MKVGNEHQAIPQASDGQATAQVISANGQTYSLLPQGQMQSVTIDGQEAIYIPPSIQAGQQAIQLGQMATGQQILAQAGQILRTSALQAVQSLGNATQASTTVAAAQQANAIAVAAAPQVVQLGLPTGNVPQPTIPVQIPISTANGTVLQSIPFPLQIMPNLLQSSNQPALQVLPQLAQLQTQQPQFAQLLPNGQVQMLTTGVGGTALSGMVSLGATSTIGATVAPLTTTPTTTTWVTGTTPSPVVTSSCQTTSVEEKTSTNQQQQQAAAAAQLSAIAAASGLTVVAVGQGSPSGGRLQAQQTNSLASTTAQNATQLPYQFMQPIIQNIPGLGQVQVLMPSQLTTTPSLTINSSQQSQISTAIPGQILPGGAQIISTAGIQPENDLTPKWVVQPAPLQSTHFLAGEVSEENALAAIDTIKTQTRLKRLACTCPNCRDGDKIDGAKKKMHLCHIPGCNKTYGKTSHLRAHLRWHSGDRPFACSEPFCVKRFTRSDELQRHMRTHSGDKRFECSQCKKRFMRSDHLSKHMKTHAKKSANVNPSTADSGVQSDSSSSSDNELSVLTIRDPLELPGTKSEPGELPQVTLEQMVVQSTIS